MPRFWSWIVSLFRSNGQRVYTPSELVVFHKLGAHVASLTSPPREYWICSRCYAKLPGLTGHPKVYPFAARMAHGFQQMQRDALYKGERACSLEDVA